MEGVGGRRCEREDRYRLLEICIFVGHTSLPRLTPCIYTGWIAPMGHPDRLDRATRWGDADAFNLCRRGLAMTARHCRRFQSTLQCPRIKGSICEPPLCDANRGPIAELRFRVSAVCLSRVYSLVRYTTDRCSYTDGSVCAIAFSIVARRIRANPLRSVRRLIAREFIE